ncbi:MAG: copper resistance protein B [Myxococcota bacterium]
MLRDERHHRLAVAIAVAALLFSSSALGQDADQEADQEAKQEAEDTHSYEDEGPALPKGMTLDETLDRAEEEPPDDYPQTVPDDHVYAFLLGEHLEYRFRGTETPDQIGWELQGWFGGDLNKLWWKHDAEFVYESPAAVESETDVLYSRLITPFWNAQAGIQYANEWGLSDGDYEDRWSGVIGIQGMAPGMFEIDVAAYVSQDFDFTFSLEAEYDIRITQRLVLQPLTELSFAAQDIPERGIGAGMTDMNVDLRLRYEILREFAPYIGGRWQSDLFETAQRTRDAGGDPSQWMLIGGIRFAIL